MGDVLKEKTEAMKKLRNTEKTMSKYDSDSSLRVYMREIAKTELLTAKEEVKLAAKIKRGDKKAREHMIKANLRLVVKIAQDYSNYGLLFRISFLRGI